MAIAFDATSSGDTGGATSLTFAHTCSGTNRRLYVSVIGSTSAGNISGVTYNGVAMTLIDSVQGNGSRYNYLFCLINPALGSNNIVVTPTASSFMSAVSASYTGTDQTSIFDAHTTNSNNGTSPITTSLTTIADNCWTVLGIHCESGQATASTGSTFRVKDATFNSPAIFDSNGVVHPAGSTSMTLTTTGSGNAICMASFAPAVGLLNGIASYWKLDEASGDASDSAGGATLTNTSVTRGAGTGKINGGSTYNGSTSQFRNASSVVDTAVGTTYSFSFWVKTSVGTYQTIAAHEDDTTHKNQFQIYMGADATGVLEFAINPNNNSSQLTVYATGNLSDGNWHHCVITYSGSQVPSGVVMYVDGVSQTVNTVLNALSGAAPTSVPFYLGVRGTAGGNFTGSIDEFGLWTRVLTSGEVTSLYNGGTGLQYPFTSSTLSVSTALMMGI